MTDFQIFKQVIVLLYSKIFPKHNGAEYTFSQVAFKANCYLAANCNPADFVNSKSSS